MQQWDPELARVAQKWADQCANVDYKGDIKRKDPLLFHDEHAHRKIGKRPLKFPFLCLDSIYLADKYSNWQGVGQNVARDIAKGQAGVFDAHKLIGNFSKF